MPDPTEIETPEAPPIVREPLTLGRVAIPSRFFLAPLAGYTSLAYRLTIREHGGLGLATTDLINARAILEQRPRTFELAETSDEDRPLAIQIYGHIIDEMCRAARWVVDHGASVVDINMGCPVRKVVKTGGGSALMCQADAATELVAAVVGAVEVPVTVKMRLGWDDANLSAPALARSFEQVGAAAVIVHGRTREQGFNGRVNRDGIRAVVEAVESMPIVGNGDIRTLADAEQMFRETGCSAISIGRGSLSNPFLFRQLAHWAEHGHPGPEPSFEERVDTMANHFHRLIARRGERHACFQFRKILKWYSHAIRPRKELYHRLINLDNLKLFDETVALIRETGPASPIPGHFEPKVPVPTGPIDKW
ncbi:tRNA dihydrouridine synthase DusB [Tundrisphaera lichenicola]|uniref:tRNA dihydrouridine synthase DusB n=1 Tax=Tundrisphaera lichenicola TaxID=2029860 RepID=UPI003EBE8893